MKNHDPHIESLLKLFIKGETTLEQERELSNYFANSTSIPEEWEAYREMFTYFDAGMPIKEEKPRRNVIHTIWALLAAAAVAAIVIMVMPLFHHNSTENKTSISQPITANNNNKIVQDSIVKPEQPRANPLLAIEKRKSTKETPDITNNHATIDSIEIEREKGEVEQAQQELMADKYIAEQERQEILNEQYNSRAQAYQAQLAAQNDNPQFIQVVFK